MLVPYCSSHSSNALLLLLLEFLSEQKQTLCVSSCRNSKQDTARVLEWLGACRPSVGLAQCIFEEICWIMLGNSHTQQEVNRALNPCAVVGADCALFPATCNINTILKSRGGFIQYFGQKTKKLAFLNSSYREVSVVIVFSFVTCTFARKGCRCS